MTEREWNGEPSMEDLKGLPCKCDSCVYDESGLLCEECLETAIHGVKYSRWRLN